MPIGSRPRRPDRSVPQKAGFSDVSMSERTRHSRHRQADDVKHWHQKRCKGPERPQVTRPRRVHPCGFLNEHNVAVDASMKIIWTVFVFVLVFVVGCDEKASLSFEKKLSHPSGFSVQLPTGFVSRDLPTGFVFREAGDLRSPREIRVVYAESQISGANHGQVRQLASGIAKVSFAVHDLGAGSAGTEYEFRAILSGKDGELVVTARKQSEFGVPAFAATWAVLETIRFP